MIYIVKKESVVGKCLAQMAAACGSRFEKKGCKTCFIDSPTLTILFLLEGEVMEERGAIQRRDIVLVLPRSKISKLLCLSDNATSFSCFFFFFFFYFSFFFFFPSISKIISLSFLFILFSLLFPFLFLSSFQSYFNIHRAFPSIGIIFNVTYSTVFTYVITTMYVST